MAAVLGHIDADQFARPDLAEDIPEEEDDEEEAEQSDVELDVEDHVEDHVENDLADVASESGLDFPQVPAEEEGLNGNNNLDISLGHAEAEAGAGQVQAARGGPSPGLGGYPATAGSGSGSGSGVAAAAFPPTAGQAAASSSASHSEVPGAARGGTLIAVEVETDYEEDQDEQDEERSLPSPSKMVAAEVEEEEALDQSTNADDDYPPQSSRPMSGASSSSYRNVSNSARGSVATSGDYAVPAANREVWKAFGCNTEAGRALKRLYKGCGQSSAAALVSYPRMPSPAKKWEPKVAARKPCPQRAPVRVPRQPVSNFDPDDPRYWRQPLPGRKSEAQIRAEMEASKPEKPDLPQGRDQRVEKEMLQDRFQFCGGRAMPKGAMGYVEVSEDVPIRTGPTTRQRLEERRRRDENGMNAEQREIAEELLLAVKDKQERLKEIEEEETHEKVKTKHTTARNKEALELRNDIDRCLQDLNKLMDVAEAEASGQS